MTKYHPLAVDFVEQYLEREPEYIDFTEFMDEYDGEELEITDSDIYDDVLSILTAIRDRLDLITE